MKVNFLKNLISRPYQTPDDGAGASGGAAAGGNDPGAADPGANPSASPAEGDPAPADPEPGAKDGDPANPQPAQKQVQSQEDNAKFAAIRRETEQKAKDAVIAEMYGKSHGIYTYADYQKAVQEQQRRQEAEQKGIDPDFYNEFQSVKDELNSYKREKTLLQQETELTNDPVKGQLYGQWKDDVKSIASQYNVDLRTAFTLVLEERLPDILSQNAKKIQNETISKINENGSTSPGQLGGGAGDNSFFTREQVKAMSQSEVNKNYDKIVKSMQHWQ